ncbi:hypothetical protein PAMP_015919 [Pampus punctatissimus]
MDDVRSDGGAGGQHEVEDEFACAGMLRGSLTSLHDTVERIFRVTFRIGADDLPHGNNGQIWLKLRGSSNNVKAAKVGSPGCLLISGIAEPVVRAYSLITDLVERYEGTQSRRSETGDRGASESLESRRAFKTLVEKWDDRHILDLLVLPGSVKEILLDLVKESGLGSNPNPELRGGITGVRLHKDSDDRWDKPSAITYALSENSSTADRWVEGMTAGSGKDAATKGSLFPSFSTSAGVRGRAEGAEERQMHSPQEVGEEEQLEPAGTSGTEERESLEEEEEQRRRLSVGNKEFLLLLRFFTAMGYTEDVVKRVLARTGLKEASQILDLVQQEQDRSDREEKRKKQDVLNQRERNRPCETEHREDEDTTAAGGGGHMAISSDVEVLEVHEGKGDGATGCTKYFDGEGNAEEKEDGNEDDFVLGVLKKAAASCGYAEQNVAKVYSMLPERSTHQLLLGLQREEIRETDASKEEPREMDDVVLEKEDQKAGPVEDEARREVPLQLFIPAEKTDTGDIVAPDRTVSDTQLDLFQWIKKQPKQHHPIKSQTPEVKGPPMTTYASSLDTPFSNFQSNKQYVHNFNPPTSKLNHPTQDPKPQSSNSLKRALQISQSPVFTGTDSSSTGAREQQCFMSASSVVVTGEQRFLEGLQTPFDLQLTDKPGDPKLRTIIIDGSNVAMSHGLGHFFSCRGIALAVQHFWDRGHRHISALLPQWRQKSDSRNKEQHYLTELQKLGLLSFTPSREVQGKRISSYDDRLMLQLAQKTDGVIVTNDNLRDLSDESTVWRDIIKKRLLQYTFVGDHFMVPDDPLGRGGPHLNDFLRSEHRTPNPGNHSFAGVATTFPSFKPPRSQTEVLNFRDRTLGGTLDAAGRGSRGKGKGWDAGHQHRKHGTEGPGPGFGADRTPQETASLRAQLCQVFVGQENMVTLVLQSHPAETDINVLSGFILEQQKD